MPDLSTREAFTTQLWENPDEIAEAIIGQSEQFDYQPTLGVITDRGGLRQLSAGIFEPAYYPNDAIVLYQRTDIPMPAISMGYDLDDPARPDGAAAWLESTVVHDLTVTPYAITADGLLWCASHENSYDTFAPGSEEVTEQAGHELQLTFGIPSIEQRLLELMDEHPDDVTMSVVGNLHRQLPHTDDELPAWRERRDVETEATIARILMTYRNTGVVRSNLWSELALVSGLTDDDAAAKLGQRLFEEPPTPQS
jgi:hypothetical protein